MPIDTESAILIKARCGLDSALDAMEKLRKEVGAGITARELSLAITHTEDALMRLERAVYIR